MLECHGALQGLVETVSIFHMLQINLIVRVVSMVFGVIKDRKVLCRKFLCKRVTIFEEFDIITL